MSSSTYKGSLTVGGTALEKSKLQLRRPTPDSDVLASSDDDRDHAAPVVRPAPGAFAGGRRPSSGWLQDIQPNRKYSLPSVSFAGSLPTTPSLELPQQARPSTSAFPWNTSSFTSTQANSRLKEVLPSPTSAHAPHDNPLPSPVPIDSDNPIGFLLSQQSSNPLRKAVRSQSYSIGQGDVEHNPISQFSAARHSIRPSANLRHRPSKPSLLGESAVGLSQLREDDTDEVESSNGSEHGVRLPTGYWEREQKQALLKHAAMENARAHRNRATSTGSPVHQQQQQQRRKTTAGLRNVSYGGTADYAIEELDDHETVIAHPPASLTRRFSEHVAFGREPNADNTDSLQKQQWATGNIQAQLADGMARRHSFAHIGASYNSSMPLSTLSNTQEEDEEVTSPRQTSQSPTEEEEPFDPNAYFTGYGPASRAVNSSAISVAHPDPVAPNPAMSAVNPYAVPHVLGRPGRRLFVVTFKCSRADIYYLYDNTGLEINRGDLVIVEGDRGCDLGQVTHADVSLEDAKKHKAEANEEHFRWLVMFSQYSLSNNTDGSMLGALARANGLPNPMSRSQLTGMGAQQDQDAKPKMIKRLAQSHEIMGLRDKEGQEAKAKRLGAQKAVDHKLPMEILDAEYQADYHKLTYFYYAESYVNFNDLVTDLFKQYKVRIWMSAVNPASVVNPAGMSQIPPPSAIGPGAVLSSSATSASHAVGPGFGSNNYRNHEQYGRNRGDAGYSNFNESYGVAFSHQVPPYGAAQSSYMNTWTPSQQLPQPVFDRFNPYMQPPGYPSATGGGSPMNYGAYYPPATFAPSPAYNVPVSGTAFRGGFPSTASHNNAQSHASSNTAAANQYITSGSTNNVGSSNSGGRSSGHTPTSGGSYNNAGNIYDPTFLAATMQNMSFGSK